MKVLPENVPNVSSTQAHAATNANRSAGVGSCTAVCCLSRATNSKAISTAIKVRYVGNKDVDASSMRVETLNGTVMLSGFAKNATERSTAESIAWKVNGVKAVKNEIAVRP